MTTATTASPVEYRDNPESQAIELWLYGKLQEAVFIDIADQYRALLIPALNEAFRLGAKHGICDVRDVWRRDSEHPGHVRHVIDRAGLQREVDGVRHVIIAGLLPSGMGMSAEQLNSAFRLGALSTRLV